MVTVLPLLLLAANAVFVVTVPAVPTTSVAAIKIAAIAGSIVIHLCINSEY
jgi:hypothetical protein